MMKAIIWGIYQNVLLTWNFNSDFCFRSYSRNKHRLQGCKEAAKWQPIISNIWSLRSIEAWCMVSLRKKWPFHFVRIPVLKPQSKLLCGTDILLFEVWCRSSGKIVASIMSQVTRDAEMHLTLCHLIFLFGVPDIFGKKMLSESLYKLAYWWYLDF